MTTPRDDVVVVGAGLAGLTVARLLERLGLSVRVLERGDATGGRIRTDVLSGYRCDRGFQLLNPAYPAVRELIDLRALELRRFDAGVALPGPRRDPGRGRPRPGTPAARRARSRSGYVRPGELARLAAWVAPALGSVERLLAGEDSSLAESLDRAGVTGAVRRDIWDPFFAGVLAESERLHLRAVRPAAGAQLRPRSARRCPQPVWRRCPARSRPPSPPRCTCRRR